MGSDEDEDMETYEEEEEWNGIEESDSDESHEDDSRSTHSSPADSSAPGALCVFSAEHFAGAKSICSYTIYTSTSTSQGSQQGFGRTGQTHETAEGSAESVSAPLSSFIGVY